AAVTKPPRRSGAFRLGRKSVPSPIGIGNDEWHGGVQNCAARLSLANGQSAANLVQSGLYSAQSHAMVEGRAPMAIACNTPPVIHNDHVDRALEQPAGDGGARGRRVTVNIGDGFLYHPEEGSLRAEGQGVDLCVAAQGDLEA